MGRAQPPERLVAAHSAHRPLVHALRMLVVRAVVRDEARWARAAGVDEHVEHHAARLGVHVMLLDVVHELTLEGVIAAR
eukprot:12806735-Alexandrium_andersonii.AAC.1